MDQQHLDRREARAGDGDVVKLILSRFDDITAQIADVRTEQDTTNEYLQVQNGRLRLVEIAQARTDSKLKAALGVVTLMVTVGGLGFAAANFLRFNVTDLARLLGG